MTKYNAFVYQDDDGQWVAEAISLPDCVARDRERSGAINCLEQEIRRYIRILKEHGIEKPAEDCQVVQIQV